MKYLEMKPFIRELQSLKGIEEEFFLPQWAYYLISGFGVVIGLIAMYCYCKRKKVFAVAQRKAKVSVVTLLNTGRCRSSPKARITPPEIFSLHLTWKLRYHPAGRSLPLQWTLKA